MLYAYCVFVLKVCYNLLAVLSWNKIELIIPSFFFHFFFQRLCNSCNGKRVKFGMKSVKLDVMPGIL